MQAGAGDMRQCETGVFLDGAVEGLLGPVPGRQHAVDTVAIMGGGAVRGGGQRQIISVPVHFLIPWRAVNAKPSRDMRGDRDNIVTVRCEAVEPMPIRR